MRKIILIAYKFPPYKGVGGNRWAKLTKYFAELGCQVHVITVKWRYNNIKSLVDEPKHKNINIHYIPSGYPHNLYYTVYKNRLINLFKKEFFYYLNKIIYFDDEAQHWNHFLIPYCEKLIKSINANTVIATGHPFQANRWAAELKLRNPGIKLIQDFRDPWLHPYKNISSQKQLYRIEKWICRSVSNADLCVFVTRSLGKYFLKERNIPYEVITNGHDFNILEDNTSKENQWIFAGNLTNGRDLMACKLLDVIKKSPKIIKKNTIRFYGHFPENFFFKYKELFKNKNIEYCGIVEQKKIYEELLKSKVALHFNSELFPFALSTKIFEYAAAKVPTLTISPGGEIDDLINMNNWGIIARPEQNEIMRSIQSMQHYKADITNESIEKYHYRNIALNYLKIINNISTEKL